jgi:hypothetical protein
VKVVNDQDEWTGMPDFEPGVKSYKVIIHFEKIEERDEFQKKHKLKYIKKTESAWTTWWPFRDREDVSSVKYE